jgi:2-amino-4-hydroxy-6-hydroxymethyldihydropteridine diphosphokinase
MNKVALSLGCNMGSRQNLMQEMETRISRLLASPVAFSEMMETEPLQMPNGTQWFYNRIAVGLYSGSPEVLLKECLSIEKSLGRVRENSVKDRTSDIDILLFGDAVISLENLKIPHPALLQRRFCLYGLMQTAPDMKHPVLGKSFHTIYNSMEPDVGSQRINIISS